MSVVKTILLNAFPAGGKSEIRRFLRENKDFARSFMVGEAVQLDDYPYVKFMREIDECLRAAGFPHFFYEQFDRGFMTGYEWGSLTELVNEDYDDLIKRAKAPKITSATRWLIERIDRARAKVGIRRFVCDLPAKAVWAIEDRLEASARDVFEQKYASIPESLEGKTIFIEFSRGGPDGCPFPLPAPHGYQYTYGVLSDAILADAAILYVWVTAEMSRAKNIARGQETPISSGASAYTLSLNHTVPMYVMLNEYGVDDLEYLLSVSGREGCVKVTRPCGKEYFLPVARFDNRKDYTTFCRGNPKDWPEECKKAITQQLTDAFSVLVKQYKILHP